MVLDPMSSGMAIGAWTARLIANRSVGHTLISFFEYLDLFEYFE
jgi:hypothetical protein